MKYKKTAKAIELETTLAMSSIDVDFSPTRAVDSNGYDLRACTDQVITIFPDEVYSIGTGVHVWLGNDPYFPEDVKWAGLLMPRSSSKGAILNNTIGLLDYNYQGELIAKYRNTTAEPINFAPGEKFAQLLIVPSYIGKLIQVDDFGIKTTRGENGFGHTGK